MPHECMLNVPRRHGGNHQFREFSKISRDDPAKSKRRVCMGFQPRALDGRHAVNRSSNTNETDASECPTTPDNISERRWRADEERDSDVRLWSVCACAKFNHASGHRRNITYCSLRRGGTARNFDLSFLTLHLRGYVASQAIWPTPCLVNCKVRHTLPTGCLAEDASAASSSSCDQGSAIFCCKIPCMVSGACTRRKHVFADGAKNNLQRCSV